MDSIAPGDLVAKEVGEERRREPEGERQGTFPWLNKTTWRV